MDSYRFNVGDFECVAISDGGNPYVPQSFFANVPAAEVEEALRQRGLPTDHVFTPYTCLYVNSGTQRVLVDTGLGARLSPNAGTLLRNMKATGIAPEDIDTVIITHAHPDHIGGNLDDDGRLVYANARYVIWRSEWDFWRLEIALEKGKLPEQYVTFMRSNLDAIQDRVNFLDREAQIVPGIHAIATPGHTPGHIALSILSGGEQLLHISDAVLYPLHLEYPDWTPIFDVLPEQAAISKRRIFDRAAEERALVFAHHFPPFPNLGYVTKRGNGWQWQPIEPAN